MSAEDNAYNVNKLRLKTWIWRHKQRTPNTNGHHMPLNDPPHENYLRTPLHSAHWSHSHWIFQTCGSIASDSLVLLFTQHKITLFAAISSHCLAALHAKTSAFNSTTWQNAYCRNLEDLLPRYCYAIKNNSRTIRSQVTQAASAGKSSPSHNTINRN